MSSNERSYAVGLGDRQIGWLRYVDGRSSFYFSQDYLLDPERPVLGLMFEQNLNARYSATQRLPYWFSNLLPEGRLRDWIAAEKDVSPNREVELLAQVGHDLPGAVNVTEVDAVNDATVVDLHGDLGVEDVHGEVQWRFSLAGVALKFSMLAKDDRLTMPAFGAGGDWIVKLPDRNHRNVPINEFAMMSLARSVGIEVPEVRLVHRDEIDGLPEDVWPPGEAFAYAIRRFDRTETRQRVHIEDLAQVRGIYPEAKYYGNYETVAALVYRGTDIAALQEFARRLTFNILVSNGDAHLKNWSLIYHDGRIPTLSPAYDIVSTRPYMGAGENLGMKFLGSKQFVEIKLTGFGKLERRLRCEANLVDIARGTINAAVREWPQFEALFVENEALARDIGQSIRSRSASLRRR